MMYATTRTTSTIMLVVTSMLIASATELDCQVDVSSVLNVDIVNVLRQRMPVGAPLDTNPLVSCDIGA